MSKKLEVMVIPQSFTEVEKEIARNNIGALAPPTGRKLEVMVIPQEFTEAEKEIARNNIGALAPTGSSNKGVYEFTVTKVLDGSGLEIWDGDGLTVDNIRETFVNCTSATCPVHIVLNSHGGLITSLASGYNSITCISHTYVSQDANFANELGMWGHDNLCQVIAGMNRTWHLQHNSALDQNGIRFTTSTLKTGILTIKFTFVFEVL